MIKFLLSAYWEGLKEYFSTLLSVVVTAMVLVGEPTWPRKIFFCLLFNAIFGALMAGMVYCKKKLEEQYGNGNGRWGE
jgi:hypothetical protein